MLRWPWFLTGQVTTVTSVKRSRRRSQGRKRLRLQSVLGRLQPSSQMGISATKRMSFLEEVTKMRKGQGGNLDFLDNKDSKGKVGGKSRRKTSRIKSLGLVKIRET